MNEASLRHRIVHAPERIRLRAFVAELGEGVVGRVHAFLDLFTDEAKAVLELGVFPANRGRGIGSALYEAALEHVTALGAASLSTTFEENADGVSFALARGFGEVRRETTSVVDPRSLQAQSPEDVVVRPISEIDPRIAYDVDIAATRDVPYEGTIVDLDYEEWATLVLDYPIFAREGSFVAYVDGQPAAVSLLTADLESGRGGNMFTGTLAGFRGRGLARAVKVASIRWAAQHGITQIATVNDETNAAMLALNRALGYRPVGRRVQYVTRP